MQRLRVVPIIVLVTSVAVTAGCGDSRDGAGGARSRPHARTTASRSSTSSTSSTSAPSTTTTIPGVVVAAAAVVSTSSTTTTPPPPSACAAHGTTGPSQASAPPAAPALLTEVRVTGGECADSITFVFRPTTPAGVPPYTIEAVGPPFALAGSGAAIDVPGTRFLRVRFTPAWTAELETGTLTYTGPKRIDVSGAVAARAVVLYDAYEGYVGWIVGLDGSGKYTVTTATAPPSLTITVGR